MSILPWTEQLYHLLPLVEGRAILDSLHIAIKFLFLRLHSDRRNVMLIASLTFVVLRLGRRLLLLDYLQLALLFLLLCVRSQIHLWLCFLLLSLLFLLIL